MEGWTLIRSGMTVLVVVLFVAVVIWVYGSRREKFDDAARAPFADDRDESGLGEKR
ncbi:MAG: CcoQ/FixQ family Cbb3-type cytochrome c oxidase assembly chaperone [Gammaproteobacteria bacterium]|nr:CcoQ/FixQ family Cbb3-type cytochrome c oxidase assembly chaperone [Gammaproteobacteria bacterium]